MEQCEYLINPIAIAPECKGAITHTAKLGRKTIYLCLTHAKFWNSYNPHNKTKLLKGDN